MKAGNVRVDSKPVYASRITMTEVITSEQCDLKGFAYSGKILGRIDIAAGIAAKRHAVAPAVTRSVDDVAFLHPVRVGDIISIQASVNKSWKTSMEVGVKVEAESTLTHEKFFVAHAYLTFVALSPQPSPRTHLGRVLTGYQPVKVPELIPGTPMEIKRFNMAEKRRQTRFKLKIPDHHEARDLMQEWSGGLKIMADGTAPIKNYTGYPPDESLEDKESEEFITFNPKRRFSEDPRMIQPIKENTMDTTFSEVVELVMPQHANTISITFGGQIMAWMDMCARVSANRFAKAYMLTQNIDSLNFIESSSVGDVVTIRSIVTRSFNSSMEVYVSVEAENVMTGQKKFTNDGFFTISAIDEQNIPVIVPKIIPQSKIERDLYDGSRERRTRRLQQRQELIDLLKSSPSKNSRYS